MGEGEVFTYQTGEASETLYEVGRFTEERPDNRRSERSPARLLLRLNSYSTRGIAVARVRNRVLEGGHNVPEEVLRRRFHAGWRNFQQIYRDIVDHWALYDASERVPMIVAEGRK